MLGVMFGVSSCGLGLGVRVRVRFRGLWLGCGLDYGLGYVSGLRVRG